jgi:putative transposase
MRYAWIEEHRDAFGIARMCGLLEVSRSGYCQWRGRAPSDRARSNAALDAAVSKLHAVSRRSYGRPRVCADFNLTHPADLSLTQEWEPAL